MERTKFYTKEEIAEALGISMTLVNQRIHKVNDHALLDLYHSQKNFSTAEYEYIIKRLHGHLGINDSESGDNRGGVNSNV